MPDELDSSQNVDRPLVYRIRVRGQLGPHWAGWFEGLEIAQDKGDTLLTGIVIDQAALHGLFRKIRDAGLTLVSVEPADLGRDPESDGAKEGDPWEIP